VEQTPRFAFSFLSPGQIQKELHVNEGLQRLDMLLCAMVEGPPINDPPVNPLPGQTFLVGGAPAGVWEGHADVIAGFTVGGWRFVAPPEGAQVQDRTTGEGMVRRGGAWEKGVVRAREIQIGGKKVLGEQQPAIAVPTGGPAADVEARAAISDILASLQAHGLIGS